MIYNPCDLKELNRHFFRGFLDGDGWISKSGKRWMTGICSGSKAVVDAFVRFNGVPKKVTKRKNHAWQVTYEGKMARRILTNLYSDAIIVLDRKLFLYKEMVQFGL